MPQMTLHTRGDAALQEFANREIIHLADESTLHIGALDGGMQSGKPSVFFGFELPDGRVVIAETSLALFLGAANSLRAHYGDVPVGQIQTGIEEQRYPSLRAYLEANPSGRWRVPRGVYAGQTRTARQLLVDEEQALIWIDSRGSQHKTDLLDVPVIVRGTQVVQPKGERVAGIVLPVDIPVLERLS